MNTPMHSQRGVIMVLTALFIVVLVGIGALALDLGRLFILKTQMQNAVDAAAIAAAAELDGKDGAQGRAINAGQDLLSHRTAYALDMSPPLGDAAELLGVGVADGQVPGNPLAESWSTNGAFTFYTGPVTTKIGATENAEARCVEVILEPREIPLFFLPVLEILTGGNTSTAATQARALACTSVKICEFPPMMICDPCECDEFGAFIDPVASAGCTGGCGWQANLGPGDQVVLKKQQAGGWAPGDFGFLIPTGACEASNCNGAKVLGQYLANPELQDCVDPVVTTNPGDKGNWVRWGINTRFGFFNGGIGAANNIPAPNVIDYPRDDGIDPDTNRVGDGEWYSSEVLPPERGGIPGVGGEVSTFSQANYRKYYHGSTTLLPLVVPEGGAGGPPGPIARRQYYEYELISPPPPGGDLPSFNPDGLTLTLDPDDADCAGADNSPCKILDGSTGAVSTNPEDRRDLWVAILSCDKLGIAGTVTVPVEAPDGFVKFFLTEHMQPAASDDKRVVWGEFVEEGTLDSGFIHKLIQLHE